MLGTRFAITATSTILLGVRARLSDDDMTGATLILLMAVVNNVIFGSADVWPCWIVSVDVIFAEGFVSNVWPC